MLATGSNDPMGLGDVAVPATPNAAGMTVRLRAKVGANLTSPHPAPSVNRLVVSWIKLSIS